TEGSIAIVRTDHATGSGYMVGENLIATNNHVVDQSFPSDIHVIFPAINDKPISIERVRYFNRDLDIAILEVKTDRPSLALGEASEHGDDLFIIGSPGIDSDGDVLKNSVTRGTLNSEIEIKNQKCLQISASIN